jgi:hypothetical protein
MTDQVMMELAKMQSKIRAYEQNEKKHIEQLHSRDDEISELKKKIDLLELKENMIAKNKSYLESKAQKDVDQIEQNKKLKKGNNDNQENINNRRKK